MAQSISSAACNNPGPKPVQGIDASGGRGVILIHLLQWGPVQMHNTSLICGSASGPNIVAAAPEVTLVAETSQQLLTGIQVLGQLVPSTIILARDMNVPADGSWPEDLLVNMSMVLAGLPPPAPRTLLDLYQVRCLSWICTRPVACPGSVPGLLHALCCVNV